MKDYYINTRHAIDKYNQIIDDICNSKEESTEDSDEYIQNFCLYLAHALIKDTGFGQASRDELAKIANIILEVVI